MTEEEAKTKWCQFSRVMVTDRRGKSYGPAHNRASVEGTGDFPSVGGNCIGSGCMAWMLLKLGGTDGYCGMVNE